MEKVAMDPRTVEISIDMELERKKRELQGEGR
jgi:hypothetical protein